MNRCWKLTKLYSLVVKNMCVPNNNKVVLRHIKFTKEVVATGCFINIEEFLRQVARALLAQRLSTECRAV